jgi:uncharacterized membrane protein
MMALAERNIPTKRAQHTLWALAFATIVCCAMVMVRCAYAGNLRFSGLCWNVVLAWIPMLLALLIWRLRKDGSRFKFWSVLMLWVLFFPNAFYLVTDLIHMKKFGLDGIYRWFDLMMTTSFASTGVFLGCLSLYLLHLFVRQRHGWKAGWLFASGMLALGSFGIFLGRSLRLNTWDVIARPFKLVSDISGLVEPHKAKEVAAFSVTFFFFSLAVYTLVVSVARLHETETVESCNAGQR